MRSVFIVGALAVVLAACDRAPYTGYKEVAPGVYFRLLGLGGSDTALSADDSVLLRLRASEVGGDPGSLFSTQRWYAVLDLRQGAWVPALDRVHPGDSCSIILPAEGLPWKVLSPAGRMNPPDTVMVQVELAVMEALTPSMQRARAEARRALDPEGAERRELAAFLSASSEAWTRWGTSDLYYTLGPEAGDTARVRAGDRVSISYVGTRLVGGEPFDESDRHGQPFTFRFGDPDQVLPGIEVAVSLLRPGQHGRFVLPSSMAFGGKGVPLVVGPHEPVLYSVQLVSVERGPDPGT
ncbi:MAG TPA: FKBP-type peptidyl-prolyl cis-trans isomerase [Flavobacteriales bacterium]|nr:FKBP-type peptidyl-prolyl cis-trans isomerase [Flavobacteriales bacterium]HMR28411.1 FKBP-type peptidyl-prolyl cis-trans isomerase [Flavobacteriales bacterium]